MAILVEVNVTGIDEQVTAAQLTSLLSAIQVAAGTELAINYTVDSQVVDTTQAETSDDDPETEGLRTGTVDIKIS